MSPKQRSHEVPPPKEARGPIRLSPMKPRMSVELFLAARRRKAGPMGRSGRPEGPVPDSEEGVAVMHESEEISPEEKQERFSAILQEFNDWSFNEHAASFESINLHEKSERLKALIKQELKDPENKPSSNVLESWLRELEVLDL